KQVSLPPESHGVVVTWVAADGPAANALRFGDLIVAIDGKPVTCPEEFDPPVDAPTVAVSFQRNGASYETSITPIALPFKVHMVIAGFEGMYAMAWPGGRIVMSSDLEARCDDDMLAYILGHEIGHIVGKHREYGA